MTKELGEKILQELKQKSITQKELALRVGITETALSRYISGEREPKPEGLANIATALGTTSAYLLGIEREEYSHAKIRRIIARNASKMTAKEKKELIEALFEED